MNKWLLNAMRCPFCAGTLRHAFELEATDDSLEYGLIQCAGCASEFPVIEGIPVLLAEDSSGSIYAETAEDVLIKGEPVAAIITAIRAQDKRTAFNLLLNPLNFDAASWKLPLIAPDQLQRQRRSGSFSTDGVASSEKLSLKQRVSMPLRKVYRYCRSRYREFMLPRWRRALAEYLQRYGAQLSALDIIDLYYGKYSSHVQMGHYFMCRFAQPRYLAALSVAQLMRSTNGPILDVACGAGHLTHYLSYQRDAGPVVGVDRDFFRLYLAKRFIAPQAQFACVPTDPVLPFADGIFEASLCSDAFHVMRYKAPILREVRRVMSATGSIYLARISNSELEPHEGYELDVDGYAQLFGDLPCAMVGEDELRDRYLRGEGPNLSRGVDDPALRQEKWLTLVATPRKELLIEHGRFEDWPHAVGRLDVNPIYVETASDENGERHFDFCFPSAFYEYENSAYRDYASLTFDITDTELEQLNARRGDKSTQARLETFEILGMPDHYLHPRCE